MDSVRLSICFMGIQLCHSWQIFEGFGYIGYVGHSRYVGLLLQSKATMCTSAEDVVIGGPSRYVRFEVPMERTTYIFFSCTYIELSRLLGENATKPSYFWTQTTKFGYHCKINNTLLFCKTFMLWYSLHFK